MVGNELYSIMMHELEITVQDIVDKLAKLKLNKSLTVATP